MNAQNRRVPRLERLEARDLPTVLVTHHAVIRPVVPAAMLGTPAIQADAGSAGGSGSGSSSGTGVGITDIPMVAPGNGELLGAATPHEIRRELFVARLKGNYVTGPGRFTGQAAAISSLGYGGSNQMFHFWSNMRISIPTDPSQPITGTIYIIPWTVGTTGTQLMLDLQGDPTSLVNGLPTRFIWNVDPSSSGLYASTNGYTAGAGTMNIKYFPEGPGPRPATQHGQLQFAFNGFINVGGIFNVTGVLGNIPNATAPRTGIGGTPRNI
jgi:hypothetical protein